MDTPYYPDPPADAPVVSGGTVGGGGVITATATTVTVTTTVHPLWIGGSAGVLMWTATALGSAALEVTFRMAARPARVSVVRSGVSTSAVLRLASLTVDVDVSVVVACQIGDTVTLTQAWAQTPAADRQVMLAEPGFGDASPNGVAPPPPSNGLPAREADSPARRSPQVRAAQLAGNLRPDLLPRQSSLV
jgi:hypothetical protein